MPLFNSANLLGSIIWLPSPHSREPLSPRQWLRQNRCSSFSSIFPCLSRILNANFEMRGGNPYRQKHFLQLLSVLLKSRSEGTFLFRVPTAVRDEVESQRELDANQSPIINGQFVSRSTRRGGSSIGNKLWRRKSIFLMYMTLSPWLHGLQQMVVRTIPWN